jgi:phosphohistidine phosphatase
MIAIYLVRHGIAVDHQDRGPLADDDRPLTDKGRRRFRRAARAFARLGETPDFVFTSPLVRAAQTAELLVAALRKDSVGVLEELRWLNPKTRELSKGLPLRKKPVEAKVRATRAP